MSVSINSLRVLLKKALLLLVRFYQLAISPLMANHCRFEPTCSRYMLIAIERHGAAKGMYLGIKRILRCRPGVAGGWDPVPALDETKQCACNCSARCGDLDADGYSSKT